MNNTQNTPNINNNDDEIDLFELIETLWRNKGIIIAITLFFTILSGLIAFFVIKPSYQSEATIMSPKISQIKALNKGTSFLQGAGVIDQALKNVSTNEVFDVLSATLNEGNIKRQFFIEKYLPMLPDNKTIKNDQASYEAFRKQLSIKESQDKNDRLVSFTAKSPELAYDALSKYLEFANRHAAEAIVENRITEIKTIMSNIENTLNAMRQEMDTQITYQIKELQNALNTAERLGIHNPTNDGADLELFQRGTIALTDRISFLQAEKENYARNARYNALSIMQDYYGKMDMPEVASISTFQYSATPELPEKSIKPNKKLIIIIGFLLGGMLGVAFVLLRQSIRNYKLRNQNI